MHEPVDGDEDEIARGRSRGTESISTERASIGAITFDDDTIESVQSDNT